MYLNDNTKAIIVGVSKEKGVDLVMVFEEAINREKFKIYLDNLRILYPTDKLCIYFDNLSVHRSWDVRNHMEKLDIPYIFCPAYSPDFNGIESVFSIFKNRLKRERLIALANDRQIDLEEQTRKIFDKIEKDKIIACINFSLNKLFNHK